VGGGVGGGLPPPRANVEPVQTISNAAVNTEQVFVPNIAVYTHTHLAACNGETLQEN
jgi:hypothetical protein